MMKFWRGQEDASVYFDIGNSLLEIKSCFVVSRVVVQGEKPPESVGERALNITSI